MLKLKTNWRYLTYISILAGLIYNSWPFGYILNPPVAHALASNLEGLHQPYNWFFIGGDIVSSIMLIAVAVFIMKRYGEGRRWIKAVVVNSVLFSTFTIADAALPLRCIASAQICPNFTHDPMLLVHGICSILASVFLFFAIFYLWREMPSNWALRVILVGYVIFGLFSLVDALTDSKSALSQHFYISLCSIVIAMIPWSVGKRLAEEKVY